ncbi:hypothetical protein Ahy_A10g047728 [Arachis hypogaea]|uniref:Replication protein A 70 kDa DNA-binding subunit B/D first OB fold domain-containing protein n=1 Tax=Arachis hypogaea TaxID=3818 RepID=A0A445B3A4_ARAHY|nr:hypothetical protein Ahy_A10g047728 [Arachis hypogaea]
MAGIHKIADINPTINNLCVRIRVIRLWTLPSYGNSPLPYSIEMVWLDEDGGKIHASVKRAFVSRFMNLLEEGISYQIRYFGVGLNSGYFKTTHHEYVDLFLFVAMPLVKLAEIVDSDLKDSKNSLGTDSSMDDMNDIPQEYAI